MSMNLKMIYAIRNIEKSLGNKKYLTPSEKKTLRLLEKDCCEYKH